MEWVLWLLILLFVLGGFLLFCCWYPTIQHVQLDQEMTKDAEHARTLPIDNDTHLVILSPVRNAMPGLHYTLANFDKIVRVYPNTRVVFIENDSIDGTREFIEEEFPLILPTTILDGAPVTKKNNAMQGKSCQRVARMAALRNQLLQAITPEDDFFMMYDADWQTCVHIDDFVKAVDLLKTNDKINGVAPILLKSVFWFPFVNVLYDTFAFKNKLTQDMPQWKKAMHLQTKLHWGNEPMEVDSAFGGLAIYRNRPALPCYEPKPITTDMCECEHVGFNQQMGFIQLLPWFKLYV